MCVPLVCVQGPTIVEVVAGVKVWVVVQLTEEDGEIDMTKLYGPSPPLTARRRWGPLRHAAGGTFHCILP